MLEITLYSRMIDEYEIDLNIETFNSAEKAVLLKSLVNSNRQIPQVRSITIVCKSWYRTCN